MADYFMSFGPRTGLLATTSLLWRICFFALLFLQLLPATVAQECGPSTPCSIGCCSKFGFCGVGPDFCAPEVCVNSCDFKADCDPVGWGKDYVKKEKCPLNVCCSKHGFCGTTEEFCGNKPVKRPSCEVEGQGFERIVGYYEGWSPNRPCNKFYPEQIPRGVYTHLNFAFATIDPASFEVRLASSSDGELLQRLANLKGADPNLKVLIAIGGWTFNDAGPTERVFSDLAASPVKTALFAISLVKFMAKYNLDGVDIDWEYPEATDRHGRPEDYANFPAFLARLKAIFQAMGRNPEISITIPASFWYLQHFDLVNLQKSVDFFNVMTYDFHGTWDMENRWVGPYLNSHTNLTELRDGLDLLWRNGIKSEKVVMGMAFYGRSFSVANPACTSPGCEYGSGSPVQQCSREVSVALNSEIEDIMAQTGAKPVLDRDAAVKMLVWGPGGNQWVTFDDQDTLKIRADFARSQCLGGVMVWAVSHDTKKAKYSNALAVVAKKKFQALAVTDDGTVTIKEQHKQCKWTGCLENCPAGWIRMMREDGDAREGEFMTENQGCLSGQSQLCCPPDGGLLPTCGWYSHNNGRCEASCPIAHMEIGSINDHCRSGYQAACCSVAPESMQLHNRCTWTKPWPDCDSGSCASIGSTEFASSGTGSGGAFCKEMGSRDIWGYPSDLPREQRKLCCRDDIENFKWEDCKWYERYGIMDQSWPTDACYGSCPENKVRVAKDLSSDQCSQGGRVRCCSNGFHTITKRDSESSEELRGLLDRFLDDPTCTDNHKSDDYQYQIRLAWHVKALIFESADARRIEIWDDTVGLIFPNLKMAKLREWATTDGEALLLGNVNLSRAVMCGLEHYNALLGGTGITCPSTSGGMAKRSWIDTLLDMEDAAGGNFGTPARFESQGDTQRNVTSWHSLNKRAGETYRDYEVYSPLIGASVTFTLSMMKYPSTGDWYDVEAVWQKCIDFASNTCNTALMGIVPTVALARTGWDTEHPFERQSVANFIKATIAGTLPGALTSVYTAIDPSFWTGTGLSFLPNNRFPGWPISDPESASLRRLMHCVGSDAIKDVFTMAPHEFNAAKGAIWGYGVRWAEDNMETLVNDMEFEEFLQKIKITLGVIAYMNVPTVRSSYALILHRMRWVLAVQQWFHWAQFGVQIDAVGRFDEWWGAHTQTIVANVQTYSLDLLTYAASRWGTRIDVMQSVDALVDFARNLAIRSGYYPTTTYQITVQPPSAP